MNSLKYYSNKTSSRHKALHLRSEAKALISGMPINLEDYKASHPYVVMSQFGTELARFSNIGCAAKTFFFEVSKVDDISMERMYVKHDKFKQKYYYTDLLHLA